MAELYLAMIVLTGLFVYRGAQPRDWVEWGTLLVLSALWPAFLVYVVCTGIKGRGA